MTSSVANSASWMPQLIYGDGPAQTRKWKIASIQAVTINCADPLTVAVFQSAASAQRELQYELPVPELVDEPEEGDPYDNDEARIRNKVAIEAYKKDQLALPAAKIKAFAILMSAIVEGSTSANILENNQDWSENLDGTSRGLGYMSCVRALKAINSTHISHRQGTSDDSVRETQIRRLKADHALSEELIFSTSHTPDSFHKAFTTRLKERKDEGCAALSELQQVLMYLGKVSGNTIYRSVARKFNDGTWAFPIDIGAVFAALHRHQIEESSIPSNMRAPAGSISHGYVLATSLVSARTPKDSKPKIREQSPNEIWSYPREEWIAMSAAQQLSTREHNAAIHKSRDANQKSKRGTALIIPELRVVSQSNGEYSDEDEPVEDIDSQYNVSTAMVTYAKPSGDGFAAMNDSAALRARNKNQRHFGLRRQVKEKRSVTDYQLQQHNNSSDQKLDKFLAEYRLDRSVQKDDQQRVHDRQDIMEQELYKKSEDTNLRNHEQQLEKQQAAQRSIKEQFQAERYCADKQEVTTAAAPAACAHRDQDVDSSVSPAISHTQASTQRGALDVVKSGSSVFTASKSSTSGKEMTPSPSSSPWFRALIGSIAILFILGLERLLPQSASATAVKVSAPTTHVAMPVALTGSLSRSPQRRTSTFNPFLPHYVAFDSAAEVHVAKESDFISNMRRCAPGSIGGINPDDPAALHYKYTCSIAHERITGALYLPSATSNIISSGLAIDQGFVKSYDPHLQEYTLYHPMGGKTLRFGRVPTSTKSLSKLYIMDMKTSSPPLTAETLSSPSVPTIVLTIAQNKAKYTKREVLGAEKALRFMDCIGQPPLRQALAQLRSTLNPPITEADLKRSDDIFGPRISYVKAVTTAKGTPAARTDTTLTSLVPIHATMEVDIMFVKRRAFLVAIMLPIDYAMTQLLTDVGGRTAASLAKALIQIIAKAKSRNFSVGIVSSDNEGGIAKNLTAQQIHEHGIELAFIGAGGHCPHIERRIRFIKEKFRRHEHRLQYAMNNTLVDWAVLAATRETNMQQTASSTSLLSPREKFLGRQYDFKRDGRTPFGTYVQLRARTTDNTASARTEGSIILMPRDNLTGTMYAYNINTLKIVTREQYIELPMSDELISHMNALAEDDGLSRGSEPFLASEYGVPEDDDAQAVLDTSSATQPLFQAHNHDTAPRTRRNLEVQELRRSSEDAAAVESQLQLQPPSTRGAIPLVDLPLSTTAITDSLPSSSPQLQALSRGDYDTHDAVNTAITSTDLSSARISPQPSRAVQLRGGSRGASQVNSIAGLEAAHHVLSTGINFSEAGTNFNDAAFERKFNAQLHHTRQWHDRDFALQLSWQRAIKTYGTPARLSIEQELQQMIDKRVWHPLSFNGMNKFQRTAAVRAKMFVIENFFPSGAFEKIKSRFVVRGDMQDRSLYTQDDTSAPTAELSSVMSVAAIAACESRYIATCDIGGAFLNADMFKGNGRSVIVKIDKTITAMLLKLKPDYETFIGDDGYLFVELDKAMYGCIESAKLWYEHLRKILVTDLGFEQNIVDACTFNKTDDAGYQITVIMHVDDMLITCANKRTLDNLLSNLADKFPETKCHYGPCVPFLGMDLDFKDVGNVRITMHGAEADIIATAGDIGARDTNSPALDNLFVVNQDNELVSEADQDWFRSNVAKLLYLGKRARPEILTAISFLATRAAKADSDDLGKLRRVLRYIRSSTGRGIRLSPGTQGVHVRAYVDAAYGVHMDGKSHTGVSIILGDAGPVFVRSTKQPITAKSSTEAELIGTSDSANQVFHIRNFIIAQGHGDQPAQILQDNMSCMALLAKGKSTSMRTRHIQIRYFWVKERVDNGEAIITHMRSESMGPANALTKPLVGHQFIEERQQLTNWD